MVENSHDKPTDKPFPPELYELVDALLKITADKHPGEIIIIGAVPYFWNGQRAGVVWVVVEDTWRDDGKVNVNVRAITGKPFKFQGYHGNGWSNESTFSAGSLSYVTKVENENILAYYGTAEGAGAEIFPGAEAADRLSDGYDKDWFESIEPIEF